MKHQLIILIAAKIIIIILPVLMLLITTIKVETSFAYVTQSSSGIAAADPNYCDKAGYYPTCYDMGYKGGLIDGQQDVQNGLRYSALAACVGAALCFHLFLPLSTCYQTELIIGIIRTNFYDMNFS